MGWEERREGGWENRKGERKESRRIGGEEGTGRRRDPGVFLKLSACLSSSEQNRSMWRELCALRHKHLSLCANCNCVNYHPVPPQNDICIKSTFVRIILPLPNILIYVIKEPRHIMLACHLTSFSLRDLFLPQDVPRRPQVPARPPAHGVVVLPAGRPREEGGRRRGVLVPGQQRGRHRHLQQCHARDSR